MGGWVWVELGGGTPTHMCMHTHTRTHTNVRTHMTSQGIPRYSPYGGSHLHEIIMLIAHTCMCARVRVCACMCVCVWGGGLPPPTHTPIHPPNHPPTPQMGGNTQNSEISIHLELIKIIRFCLKNIYL